MKVKLLPWQLEVENTESRYKVICAGRRAGKSVYSRMKLISWAVKHPGLYWIVAPTYRQAKMIHWTELKKSIPDSWKQSTNETELSITLNNGAVVQLRGAENPDSLRGVKLSGLLVDEIASIRNWEWLWREVLEATLLDEVAPAIFISTPKGFNHFHKLFEAGQGGDPEYKSWRFTSYDNPTMPEGELEKIKESVTEDTFAQEYLADFRKHTGLVYKLFERDTHVIEPFEIPEGWSIYRGIDFGSTNPTACVWVAVDGDGNHFIIDEHYESGRTIDYHAGVINSAKYSPRVTRTYGDPAGKQWMDEFQTRGVYISPAEAGNGARNVQLGIEKIQEKLKKHPGHSVIRLGLGGDEGGSPKMFVFNNCLNTIREFEAYRWRQKSTTRAQDLNEPDVPEKANDHLMDALRYMVMSAKPKTKWVSFPEENLFGDGGFY